ncbi:MAG: hypothetical protein VXY24_05615 [Pseudomonadota bacterium]|nr:hypothetical protein [Pseudomonadota bacterium]
MNQSDHEGAVIGDQVKPDAAGENTEVVGDWQMASERNSWLAAAWQPRYPDRRHPD